MVKRSLLVLIASWVAASGVAQAQDRYGPTSAARTPAYEGPMLGWAAKSSATPGVAQAPAPRQPEPLALARQFLRGPQAPAATPPVQQAPQVAQAPAPPAYAPPPQAAHVPATPPPSAFPQGLAGAAPSSLPQGLYDAPPQRLADAAGAVRRTGGVGSQSRLYSVHRPYGLSPDEIPEPPQNNLVLIGPPDAPLDEAQTPDDDDGPF